MQIGDRVRKTSGKFKGEEGVVVSLSPDGVKVLVKSDAHAMWREQSADNFARLQQPPPAAADGGTRPPTNLSADKFARLQQPAAAAATRPPTSPVAGPAQVRDPEEYDTWYVASLAYSPDVYVIPGLLGSYTSGKARNMRHAPYKLDSVAWYVNKDAAFPKEFTEVSVKCIPRPEGADAVRWGRERYSLVQWRQLIAEWQVNYPNLTHANGSNCHETVGHRGKKTSNPDTIKHCFFKCKVPTWPANLSGYSKALLASFRVDSWGNMVCLPKSVGGLADNDALCFFDVDHIFPFSRGGRSMMKNFEALQHGANRWVKVDNLVQTLNPREMLCGVSAAQLLALVWWAEIGGGGKGQKDKQKRHRMIEAWLTELPPNGGSFRAFQTDVKYSADIEVLILYFGRRSVCDLTNLIGPLIGIDLFPNPPLAGTAHGAVARKPAAAACLKVRVIEKRVEVWGATYCVKEPLKNDLNFIWDHDDGRKCWWKPFGQEKEKGRLLQSVQRLAQEHSLQYTLTP